MKKIISKNISTDVTNYKGNDGDIIVDPSSNSVYLFKGQGNGVTLVNSFNNGVLTDATGAVYAVSEVDVPAPAISSSGLVVSGAGKFGGINVSSITGTIVFNAYNTLSATGTPIWTQSISSVGVIQFARKILFSTGLYISFTGTSTIVPLI